MQILTVTFFFSSKNQAFLPSFFLTCLIFRNHSEKEFPDTYAARQTRREKNVLSFL
jgi:hypothetical protein